MIFRVENLGPLRSAEVDLSKPLILLTGPNNTGKTYLAWSVFGLFRSPDPRKALRPLVDEILAAPEHEIDFERIRDAWPSLLDAVAERFAEQVHLCFATTRQSFPDVKISLKAGEGEPKRPMDRMTAAFFLTSQNQFIRVEVASRIRVLLDQHPSTANDSTFLPTLSEILTLDAPAARHGITVTLSSATRRWWPFCTLLTAERTAIDLFANELSMTRAALMNDIVEAQLDGAPDVAALTRQVGRYPWPIQDSLKIANDLSYYSKQNGEYPDLAIELENILGGKVGLSDQGEFQFSPKQEPTQSLGIHLTSSIVKSLAGLVFYLRHRARRGDLLMIDEPELNLHPDNQRLVTRVLAKAVNRGLRIIMSTHSDYILREINNLILLSRDTEPVKALRAKYQFADDQVLKPEQIGAYLFRDGRSETIPVTEDGFEVQTIEDEINRLNQISQEIYAALA